VPILADTSFKLSKRMSLDRAIKQGAFGPPPPIRRRATRRGRALRHVAPYHPMKREGRSG
jgi:hypothetical protein